MSWYKYIRKENELNAKAIQWCYVNIDNEFKFMNKVFVIDSSVEQYKVFDKAGEVEDYKNTAYMDKILVVLTQSDELKFYDQKYTPIDNDKIKVKNN